MRWEADDARALPTPAMSLPPPPQPNYPQVHVEDGVEPDNTMSKFSSTGVLFTPVDWAAGTQVYNPVAVLVNASADTEKVTVYSENALKTAYIEQKTFSCPDTGNTRNHQFTTNCPLNCADGGCCPRGSARRAGRTSRCAVFALPVHSRRARPPPPTSQRMGTGTQIPASAGCTTL